MSELGASFNKGASSYDRSRSDYPQALIEDVISMSGIEAGSNILEIGCGTGQATLSLADKGFNILAHDPGEKTIDVLRQKGGDLPNLRLVTSTFEELDIGEETFELVVSAQAFHWVDPEIASPKIAGLLRPNGNVALFWHMQDVMEDSPQAALQEINGRYIEGYPAMMPPEYSLEFLDVMAGILCKDERIERSGIYEYPWQRNYTGEDFLKLYRTWSRFQVLEEQKKQELETLVRNHVEEQGDDLSIQYRTCLLMAHRT